MPHVKSVHFPLSVGTGDPRLTAGAECGHCAPKREKPSVSAMPSIPRLGALWRDNKLVEETLKSLTRDEGTYHGSLQIILTALCRQVAGVKALIEESEAGG